MNDWKFSVSVSVPSVLAWLAWGVMATLLAVHVLTDDATWAAFALAAAAVAATLHMRVFCMRLNRNIRAAFDLGRMSVGGEPSLVHAVRD